MRKVKCIIDGLMCECEMIYEPLLLTPIFDIGLASEKFFGETKLGAEFESSIRGIDIRTKLIENQKLIPWVLGIALLLGIMYILLKIIQMNMICN